VGRIYLGADRAHRRAKTHAAIAIANFRGVHSTDWGLIFAASLTAVIPTLVIFIIFQRYFVQGVTAGAVKG